VLPTFHPAAAIYDRLKLPKLEADFDLLGRLLEMRHKELAEKNGPQATQNLTPADAAAE
jgi:hypothetical protein